MMSRLGAKAPEISQPWKNGPCDCFPSLAPVQEHLMELLANGIEVCGRDTSFVLEDSTTNS